MKKALIFFILILSILLIGCSEDSDESSSSSQSPSELSSSEAPRGDFTIEYRAGEGGKITGTAIQYPNAGEATSTVRATADPGYRFKCWDDGVKAYRRSDVATENKVYTAIFVKLNIVKFECDSNQGSIDGLSQQGVEVGKSTSAVTARPKTGFKFICWDNGETSPELQITPNENVTITAIFAPESLEFPSLSINTEGGEAIVSKEDYLSCTVDISNAQGGYNLTKASASVRGRGNTSFDVEKKSYKLKFDEKINLFGFGEAKDWALISNHFDLSLIRNYLALTVASSFEALSNTSRVQFVDLYINGEYRGVYLLCEQIEVKEHRVEISTSTDADTGYLLEIDSRADTVGVYVMGKYHSFKHPDIDDGELNEAQRKFIVDFLLKTYNTVAYKTYAEACELIDMNSFAQAYIVYEVFKCVDVGFASFHMYKDAGGKLTCGPVWDFDRSVGSVRNNEDARRYDSLWAKQSNIWFSALLNHDEFKALVAETLEEYLPKIKATLSGCYAYIEACQPSLERNFERWRILGTWVYPNTDELCSYKTWQEHFNFVKAYLENSLAFMCESYPRE